MAPPKRRQCATMVVDAQLAEALPSYRRNQDKIEQGIDFLNGELAPLTSFILPGGSPPVAALHLARAIVRRAERSVAALADVEPINPRALAYLNRLSDHLFVCARHVAADGGGGDVLWQPGATR